MEIKDSELVHLARLALDGKTGDVAAIVRRLSRRIRESSPKTAEALSRLVDENNNISMARGKSVAHLPVDLESRLELAKVDRDVHLANDPIWTPEIEHALRQTVAEREQAEALAQADLHPARSLLFDGPPGVGKTLSAKWLASQLQVPLITLDLSAVMSSFLGRTGNNLRNILDYAKGVGCVLLLDEFDAIAKRRDDAIEVGELKRLVTVLLQEIDCWPASGVLVAATNHPELLDPAVWRRFDMVIHFALPDESLVRGFIDRILGEENSEIAPALAAVMKGMSFSDIEREVLRARRTSILSKITLIESLEAFISGTLPKLKSSERISIAAELTKLGYGQRRTKKLTGVSRDTIRKQTNKCELEDDDG